MTESQKLFLNPGAILNDKWMILDLAGKGAMGEVYHARQLNLQRDVAIKVISQEWLQANEEELGGTETIMGRFRREFQAMAQVRHPNILQIYDYGSCVIPKEDKSATVEYIAMEYVPGATLRFTMSDEGFEPDEKLIKEWLNNYFLPVLDGVQALHAQGIVHRDLKPENILLDGNIPKITDFGLARSLRLKPLSRTADAQGTLGYMPPEQFIDFKRVDQRGDLYSLGRILFEALAGKMSQGTIPFKQVQLTNPKSPFLQRLDRIIREATAENRDQRMESAEKMRSLLLEAIRDSEAESNPGSFMALPFSRWAHPRWIWGGLALTFLAVLLMGLWHFLGDPGKFRLFGKATARTEHRSTPSEMSPSSKLLSESLKALPASIMGEDGSSMLLIPGGDLRVNPEDQVDRDRKVRIRPFYMDAHTVSNENFVQFLNEVKETVVVEKGVVKGNGRIWFLMGEGTEVYEQIIHQHGRFHLKDLGAAAQPVVRVTWYGAMAYAEHYHKKLPSEDQWIYAAFHGRSLEEGSPEPKKGSPDKNRPNPSSGFNDHLSHMVYSLEEAPKGALPQKPQSLERPAKKNSNSPKNMGGEIREWAVRSNDEPGPAKEEKAAPGQVAYASVILGRPSLLEKSKIRSQFISNRYPWEGFPNVGFRCIVEVGIK